MALLETFSFLEEDDFVYEPALMTGPAPDQGTSARAFFVASLRAEVAARHLHFLYAVFPAVAVLHVTSQLPPRLFFGVELLRGAAFCARAVAAVAAVAAVGARGDDLDVAYFAAGLAARVCLCAALTTVALGFVVVPHRDVVRLLAHVHTVPPILGLRTLRTRLLTAGDVMRWWVARAASRSRRRSRVSFTAARSAEPMELSDTDGSDEGRSAGRLGVPPLCGFAIALHSAMQVLPVWRALRHATSAPLSDQPLGAGATAAPQLRAALAQAASRVSSTACLLCASAALVAFLPHSAAELDAAAAAAGARRRGTALARLRDQLSAADSPSAALRAACACVEALSALSQPPDGGCGWRLASVGAAAVAPRRSSLPGDASPCVVVTHVEVSGPTPASRSSLRAALPPPGAPTCRCAPASPPRSAPPLCAAVGFCRRGTARGSGGGVQHGAPGCCGGAGGGGIQHSVLGCCCGGGDGLLSPGRCAVLPLSAGTVHAGFLVLHFSPSGGGGARAPPSPAAAPDERAQPQRLSECDALPPLPHGALREAAAAVGAWLLVHQLMDGGAAAASSSSFLSYASPRAPSRARLSSDSLDHHYPRRVSAAQPPPSAARFRRRSVGSVLDSPLFGDARTPRVSEASDKPARSTPAGAWSGAAGLAMLPFFTPPPLQPSAPVRHTAGAAGPSPPASTAEERYTAACAVPKEVAAAAALVRAASSDAAVLASWATDFTDMSRPEAERLCVAMAHSANVLKPNRVTCTAFGLCAFSKLLPLLRRRRWSLRSLLRRRRSLLSPPLLPRRRSWLHLPLLRRRSWLHPPRGCIPPSAVAGRGCISPSAVAGRGCISPSAVAGRRCISPSSVAGRGCISPSAVAGRRCISPSAVAGRGCISPSAVAGRRRRLLSAAAGCCRVPSASICINWRVHCKCAPNGRGFLQRPSAALLIFATSLLAGTFVYSVNGVTAKPLAATSAALQAVMPALYLDVPFSTQSGFTTIQNNSYHGFGLFHLNLPGGPVTLNQDISGGISTTANMIGTTF